MTVLKTSPPPLCMDDIDVWSLIGNNFLKKSVEGSETLKVKSFNCMFLSCHICVFRVNPHSIVA